MKIHYEKKLEEEKNKITEELKSMGRFDSESGVWTTQSDVSENDADDNDNADRYEEFEEKSSLMIPLEKRLNEVELALKKLEDGTFGKCKVCNGEIEKERLDANPAAETCLRHL